MSRQSEEKRAYWRSVLERQRAGGLSVRQFCKEEGVSEASFHSWKRRLADGDHQTNASSEEGGQKRLMAKPVTKQTDGTDAFIPVRVGTAASSLVEVVHPRGYVVRVPAVFDEHSLREVLKVLDHWGDP